MEVSYDKEDEMPFDDMAPLVFDATNAWNNNTTTSEVPIDSGNTMEVQDNQEIGVSCHITTHQKEFSNEEKFPKCLAPRWKDKVVQGGDVSSGDEGGDVSSGDEGDEGVAGIKTQIPQLVLRHFPFIPRLQRMFVSSKLAKHMQ
uniref:Uncharacterized protein n=1 Tax=Chenopodium quinoa TaxID=63459 RepID=A0A803N4Q1_CHEQI